MMTKPASAASSAARASAAVPVPVPVPVRRPIPRRLPRLNVRLIDELRTQRAGHTANRNALTLITVLPLTSSPGARNGAQSPAKPALKPAPAAALAAAVSAIRERHPQADFTWHIRRIPTDRAARPRAGDFTRVLTEIAEANIYLVPTATLGVTDLALLVHAMAIGLPVLTPPPPNHLPHFITNGVEGMIADYTDAHDLTAKLSRMLFDIDLRMRMSHAGRRVLIR